MDLSLEDMRWKLMKLFNNDWIADVAVMPAKRVAYFYNLYHQQGKI